MSDAAAAPRSSPSDAGLRRILVTLCLTQITSWGVLYYAFPVLSVQITASTGWSQPSVTAAFSAALVTSALVGVGVGRRLDRHGPHAVMTAGAVLGPASLVAVACSPTLAWFIAAWIAAGVAMGAVLYPPAFAALTRWYGPDRVRALTVLTLAGGRARPGSPRCCWNIIVAGHLPDPGRGAGRAYHPRARVAAHPAVGARRGGQTRPVRAPAIASRAPGTRE